MAKSSVLTLTADLPIVFYKLNPHKFGVLKRAVFRHELYGIIKKDKRIMTDGGSQFESKIVLESELTNYLDSGWEFVANLNHERYLVRRQMEIVV